MGRAYSSRMIGEDASLVPRSLAWATDLDVLPAGRVVERRNGYLLVRSPSNPTHFWGNFLVFDDAPGEGDGRRWEELFDTEFADIDRIRHHAFAWDRVDGTAGRAHEEFALRGYTIDECIGLVANADDIQPHPRENRGVVVRTVDPAEGADEALWQAVLELQTANREEGHEEAEYLAFSRARLRDLRVHLVDGRGAWFVAIDEASGTVAASCGIIVTGTRGRFQAVDTALAYRRRGICSRLVVEAARHATEQYDAERFVIVADVGYHALGLYESLGFKRKEHVFGAFTWPESPKARVANAADGLSQFNR
jgi:ribosomal protein S18 acetylase RimI-like enzyme